MNKDDMSKIVQLSPVLKMHLDGGFTVSILGREPIVINDWKEAAAQYLWALETLLKYEEQDKEMEERQKRFVREMRTALELADISKEKRERRNHWSWTGVAQGWMRAGKAAWGSDFWDRVVEPGEDKEQANE